MNVPKSKEICSRDGMTDGVDVGINGEMLEAVSGFKYLGLYVAVDGCWLRRWDIE